MQLNDLDEHASDAGNSHEPEMVEATEQLAQSMDEEFVIVSESVGEDEAIAQEYIFSENQVFPEELSALGENDTQVLAEVSNVALDASYFPDAEFLKYVTAFDTNDDKILSQEERDDVQSIDTSFLEIHSLKGIEYFSKITTLDCSHNALESLDVSENRLLVELDCSQNQIRTLNVSENTALESLGCSENLLRFLDLEANLKLDDFSGEGQSGKGLLQKTENGWQLDMKEVLGEGNLSKVTFPTETLEIGADGMIYFQNGELPEEIEYEYACKDGAKLQVCLSVEGQVAVIDATTFPDDGFRERVKRDFDKNGDGVLSAIEVDAVTEISLSSNDDEGETEALPEIANLKGIEIFENLVSFSCRYFSSLTALDLSANKALRVLDCSDNQLETLVVSQNDALEELRCSSNELKNLDLSANKALRVLYCSDNQLETLVVSQNDALEELYCSSNELKNLELSANKALTSLDCSYNQLMVLDVTQNPNLEELECEEQTRTIQLQNTENGWQFDLAQMVGSEHAAKLTFDLEGGTLANGIISYPKNAEIPEFIYYKYLCLGNVELNGRLFLEIDGESSENPEGQIAVIDATTFPDDVFREFVKRDFDKNGDGVLSAKEVDAVTEIRLMMDSEDDEGEIEIANLKGIEIFENLEIFGWNEFSSLTALDLSANKALRVLDCSNSKLETLVVSQNEALEELICYSNKLTALDLSANKALKVLGCSGNQLETLVVSQNEALEELNCAYNELKNLDVSANKALTSLDCSYNRLMVLDVTQNQSLEELNCEDQERTIQLQSTENGWQFDLAQMVGSEHAAKLTFDLEGGTLANGIISYPKNAEIPEYISYEYPCLEDVKLNGYLILEIDGESSENPENPDDSNGGQQTEPNHQQTEPNQQQTEPNQQQTEPNQQQTEPNHQQTEPNQQQTEQTPQQPSHTVHSFGEYKITREATALAEGIRTRRCTVCGAEESQTIAKLQATMKLTATSIKLKTKQSTNKIKVSGLAAGDAVQNWQSSNKKIVTVSKQGKITAKSKTGKATITVTLKSGLKKKIKVTVQKAEVSCTKVKLEKKSITLKKGKSVALKPTISPITCVQKAKYKSSNTSVATVSNSGKIKAKKKGTATITVTVGKKKVTCKVKVK